MTCVKTGCVAYLRQYGEWLYGDAHQYGDVLVVRAVYRTRDHSDPELGGRQHFTIDDVTDWWDEKNMGKGNVSTLISLRWSNLGYDGVPL